ncbi:hypothetical protein SBV1_350005 [Verrucomicrobia bacterium]|nr:hypothetical protein SBV1_350005 [Verrucomicrobiota bacterium]
MRLKRLSEFVTCTCDTRGPGLIRPPLLSLPILVHSRLKNFPQKKSPLLLCALGVSVVKLSRLSGLTAKAVNPG